MQVNNKVDRLVNGLGRFLESEAELDTVQAIIAQDSVKKTYCSG